MVQILGVSAAEWTALVARPKLGSSDVSNQIFKDLVGNTWEPILEGDAMKVQLHSSCMACYSVYRAQITNTLILKHQCRDIQKHEQHVLQLQFAVQLLI